jgi:predicted dehydrogenase
MKLAIVGFRHGHVGAIYQKALELPYVEVVACVEEDVVAREDLPRQLGIELTHETFDQVLQDVEFDALACVDYYARRGPTVIKALQAGKHCITDKPLCTEIDQLQQIARLSREKSLIVHVDLTMRYNPSAAALREAILSGAIGELVCATVFGQHPLSWGSRPTWYFEEGKHGGTINDIMIHGIDLLRWISGMEFSKVIAASASGVADGPAPAFFQQSAQCFLEMTNGARMFGDSSYLAPSGHHAPWRFFLWGSRGHASCEFGKPPIIEPADGETWEAPDAVLPLRDPFEDFARQVEFGDAAHLGREECFRSTMAALAAQRAADQGLHDLPVPGI